MDIRGVLAKYGKLLHGSGMVIGSGGNISVRENGNMVIKKKGADMFRGDPDDYLRISIEEGALGTREDLSSETPLHVACYNSRDDIKAVIHVHSPYMVATAERAEKLTSPSYEFDCIIGPDVPVIGYIEPGSEDLARAIAYRLQEGASAILMSRHGAVSVGRDLHEAYLRVLALERACITFLHA